MIEDDRALIGPDEFRKLFFTFFKGDEKATIVYGKLIPHILVYVDGEETILDKQPCHEDGSPTLARKMISLQKLTKFIDGFNFYPLRVNKLHNKNDSKELTYVMSSNQYSSL